MMQLDAYHSNDNSEYGWDYSLILVAADKGYKVMETVYHNKEEYEDSNEMDYDNFDEAFKAYTQKAMYGQYHQKFFDIAGRKREIMKTLKLVNPPEVKDDLEDMTPEEVVSQSSETIYTDVNVLTSSDDDTALVHPAVADTLKTLRGELEEKVADYDGQIMTLENELKKLRSQKDYEESKIANINMLLSIKMGKVVESEEEFALSSEGGKLYTVKEAAELLGVSERQIYGAKDRGEVECSQSGKKCGIRFTEEQLGKARSYFGGVA